MEKFKRMLTITLLAILILLLRRSNEAVGCTTDGEGEIYYTKNKNVARINGWCEHSPADIDMFYRCVMAENGDNFRGAYLTASCIVNRYHKNYGASLSEVITAKNQFEVVSNKRINKFEISDIPEEIIAACNLALDEPETWVIAFSMGNLHRAWATPVETVDGEYFYKEKR